MDWVERKGSQERRKSPVFSRVNPGTNLVQCLEDWVVHKRESGFSEVQGSEKRDPFLRQQRDWDCHTRRTGWPEEPEQLQQTKVFSWKQSFMPLERDYVISKNFCSSRWMLENTTKVENLDGHMNHKIKMMANVWWKIQIQSIWDRLSLECM